MVPVQDARIGKIRTESGVWIPATYKTGRYADWKEKTKIEEQIQREEQDNNDDGDMNVSRPTEQYPMSRWGRHLAKVNLKKRMSNGNDKELRNPDQIVKQRMRLEFIKKRNIENRIKKIASRKKHMKKQKQKQKKK